jgi:hypothetical protein
MMGYQHLVMDRTSKVFSKVAYSSWIWFRIKILKRFVLERAMGTTDLGKVNVVDNLLDGTIVVVWMLRLLEFLEVQTGFAVKVRELVCLFLHLGCIFSAFFLTLILVLFLYFYVTPHNSHSLA